VTGPVPSAAGGKARGAAVPRLVAVGSANPAKVDAARRVLAAAFPGTRVDGVGISPPVAAQPLGEAVTRSGAVERARAALRAAPAADMGLGMEAGVAFEGDGSAWLVNWAAALDRSGRLGLGRGFALRLPPPVAEAVRAGRELGPVVAGLAGVADLPRREGAVGFLTRGLVTRGQGWEVALACALAPWLRPELYGAGEGRPPAP
jgi:inosine/xanthosine triphosphatase